MSSCFFLYRMESSNSKYGNKGRMFQENDVDKICAIRARYARWTFTTCIATEMKKRNGCDNAADCLLYPIKVSSVIS